MIGPGTSASWRTSSSGRWCSPTASSWTRTTSHRWASEGFRPDRAATAGRRRSARSAPAGCGPEPGGGGDGGAAPPPGAGEGRRGEGRGGPAPGPQAQRPLLQAREVRDRGVRSPAAVRAIGRSGPSVVALFLASSWSRRARPRRGPDHRGAAPETGLEYRSAKADSLAARSAYSVVERQFSARLERSRARAAGDDAAQDGRSGWRRTGRPAAGAGPATGRNQGGPRRGAAGSHRDHRRHGRRSCSRRWTPPRARSSGTTSTRLFEDLNRELKALEAEAGDALHLEPVVLSGRHLRSPGRSRGGPGQGAAPRAGGGPGRHGDTGHRPTDQGADRPATATASR